MVVSAASSSDQCKILKIYKRTEKFFFMSFSFTTLLTTTCMASLSEIDRLFELNATCAPMSLVISIYTHDSSKVIMILSSYRFAWLIAFSQRRKQKKQERSFYVVIKTQCVYTQSRREHLVAWKKYEGRAQNDIIIIAA